VGSVLRGWVIYDVVVAVSYLGSGRLFGFAAKQLKKVEEQLRKVEGPHS